MREINKIVVTGATSTIGAAIIREAVRRKIKVLAICSINCKRKYRLPQSDLIEIIECDISDYLSLKDKINQKYDAFFHLAWLASINKIERDNLRPQILNIQYSLDSVELAKWLNCKVYIGAGSQAEYGRCSDVIDENTKLNPETGYGAAKVCACNMTLLECRKQGIEHVWPRIFSVYGPCCADTTVIQYAIKTLLKGEKPRFSAAEQIWDFLYLDDLGRAMLMLAENGKNENVYCVGNGNSRTLRWYLEQVGRIVNPSIELLFGYNDYSEKEVMSLRVSVKKIKKDTGFEPLVAFEDGIRKTLLWNKENNFK